MRHSTRHPKRAAERESPERIRQAATIPALCRCPERQARIEVRTPGLDDAPPRTNRRGPTGATTEIPDREPR